MNKKMFNLTTGALLHDFGKLLYRYNDMRNHCISGYEYLKDKLNLDDEILMQVKCHHYKQIHNSLKDNSLAYITYIADNIAASSDRRKINADGNGFVRDIALDSIFNLLGEKSKNKKYQAKFLTDEINYPSENNISFTAEYYGKCVTNITDNLRGIEFSSCYINSLLEIMEGNLSYIPSSTSVSEVADISLFDHCKMTASIACCILQYLNEKDIDNYKEYLFKNSKEFYNEKAFLIYSMDISGIQDFIYNITSEKALKSLRSRSFYLELIMENAIDLILEKMELSRTNIIYSGGGHAYLMFSNTENTKNIIEEFEKEINKWLLETFRTSLYISGGYSVCSSNNLKNEPAGSYKEIFKNISSSISARKTHRYDADDIMYLSSLSIDDERECKLCFRTDSVLENGFCSVCNSLINLSLGIQKGQFYSIVKEKPSKNALPISPNRWLVTDSKESLLKRMKSQSYVRTYSKNEMYTGLNISSSIWVGDYANGEDFKDFSESSVGINRIAVLRADVDNLGKAFVSGFENEENSDYYVTLSRTATFSRKLALFFKRNINDILKKGSFFLENTDTKERMATIVYSGGDDIFIIGAWDDIVGFAIDLHESFKKFSQNKLTLSAGIGIYHEKYPVSSMAREVGKLEEVAKAYPNKNAVAIFSERNVYSWDIFIDDVIGEKYKCIQIFFDYNKEYGKSFLYKLLDLICYRADKINLARYVYLLSRMKPNDKASPELKEAYRNFAVNMHKWRKDKEESKKLITAIYIYIYTIRESDE